MIKKLTRHGNSMALVIDKPILELLNISSETPLEITTDGRSLTITPSRRGDRAASLAYFLKSSGPLYREAFETLGD
ncbi:AbrB family transcriptional regulator [Desulfocarbo indianensis]|nr:AbrB family transcriptional regulator [Desulfocarbo indianensis]